MFKIGDRVILPFGDHFGLHKGEKGIIEKEQHNIYSVKLKDNVDVNVPAELLKYDKSA